MKGFTSLQNIARKSLCFLPLAFTPVKLEAQELFLEKHAEGWVSSEIYLQSKKPQLPEFKLSFAVEMRRIAVESFNNIDQAKEIQKLHTEVGTRPHTFGEGFLAPTKPGPAQNAVATAKTRWTLLKNMRTYAGKAMRFDFVPASFKEGLRFDMSKDSEPTAAVRNGTPVRYGLILKNIEPSTETMALASLYSDYELIEYAPKAQLHYEVGPLGAETTESTPYTVNIQEPTKGKKSLSSYLPNPRLRGKFSPRGLPTPSKPLPDQTLTLEQVDGYYSAEVQFVNGLKKEALYHRFALPLYGRFSVYEEYDESFKPRKIVLNNYLYSGGFSANLENYLLENRYQAGFFYKKDLLSIDLYAHVPKTALEDDFWPQHRWDLGFSTAF